MKFSEYILQKSEQPWYAWIVFLMTVCESVFLFIPPEVFMTPAIVANKKRAVPIITAAALGSLVGGLVAYLIGALLFDSVGVWIINTVADMNQFAVAQEMFKIYGVAIIIVTAVTPIPYKLLGICAGFMGYPVLIFLGVSAIFRTARFALVGGILWRFQEFANRVVKKYFWPLVVGAIVFAVAGITVLSVL